MTRLLFSKMGKGKFFFFWAVTLLFGLSMRTVESVGLMSHVLAVLNDQYYAVFAALPVFLFLCACVMEDDSSLVQMRYGMYGRYFFAKWRSLVLLFTVLWLGQMTAVLFSGWGLSLEGGWDSGESLAAQEIFSLMKEYFAEPVAAVLGCALQFLLGFSLIGLASLWLGHFCSRTLAVKLLMGLYVVAVLWIKLPIMSRPPFVFVTGFNHWILLLHNLTSPWRLILTVVTTLVLAAGIIWSVRWKWQWRLEPSGRRGNGSGVGGSRSWRNRGNRRSRGLALYYRRLLFTGKNVWIAISLVLLVGGWSWFLGGRPENGADWVMRFFAGHGTGYFYPMGLLALLIIETFALWPLGAWLTRVTGEGSAFLMIRMKQRKELMGAILYTAFLWLLFYGVLLIAAATLPPVFLDVPVDMGLTAAAVALRLLDVGVQALLIIAAVCLTGQAVVGFTAIVLMHFLCVLPLPWMPVGLSSLTRLSLVQTEGTVPPLCAAGYLIVLAAGLLIWIWGRGAGRLFDY